MANPSGRPDLAAALKLLSDHGAVFLYPDSKQSLSLVKAAAYLDVKPRWLKANKQLIEGWWRMPGGLNRFGPSGDLRFPIAGLDAWIARRQEACAA